MNNEIARSGIDLKDVDFKNVEEMISGCNYAEVTFAMNDRGRLCRLVTLYSGADFMSDYVVAGNSQTMKAQGDIPVFRNISYSIHNGAVHTGIKRYTVLLKSICGSLFHKNKDDE